MTSFPAIGRAIKMLSSGFIVAAILSAISLAFIHDFWRYFVSKSLKLLSGQVEAILSVIKELVAIFIALWIFKMCRSVFEQHSPTLPLILFVILFAGAYIVVKLYYSRK